MKQSSPNGVGGGRGIGINEIMDAKGGRVTLNACKCVQGGGGLENQTFSAYVLNGCPLRHINDNLSDFSSSDESDEE